MQKNIVKTSPVSFSHLMLEFEGGRNRWFIATTTP